MKSSLASLSVAALLEVTASLLHVGQPEPARPASPAQDSRLRGQVPVAFVPNVGRGLSLVPDAVRSARDLMLAHYMKYEQVVTDWEPRDRPISRSQMELVASRTSAKNDCFY